jgi:prephenate dehydrogenase
MKSLKKISVIGMGLLGASVTLSVKRALQTTKVVGYSHRLQTRDKARQNGVADKVAETLEEAIENADLVILATPIMTFKDYFAKMSGCLKNGCVVTDVGSTKRLPHKWASECLPEGIHYVGSHPIAGSEKRGVEYARDDLLTGAVCIVTKTAASDAASVKVLEQFWTHLGCTVKMMTPVRHDRIFGLVSHLPHLTAAALVNANTPADMQFAGRGFIDTTRVASGPANVWADILMTNPKTCAKGIDALIDQLKQMQKAIAAGDAKKVEKLLEIAAAKRAEMIRHKIKQKELF